MLSWWNDACPDARLSDTASSAEKVPSSSSKVSTDSLMCLRCCSRPALWIGRG